MTLNEAIDPWPFFSPKAPENALDHIREHWEDTAPMLLAEFVLARAMCVLLILGYEKKLVLVTLFNYIDLQSSSLNNRTQPEVCLSNQVSECICFGPDDIYPEIGYANDISLIRHWNSIPTTATLSGIKKCL